MTTRLRIAALILMLAAAIQSARGGTPTTKPFGDFVQLPPGQASVVLPLTHAADWLCTKVSIDGNDVGWFIVDTGASVTTLEADTTRRLNLKRIRSAPINTNLGDTSGEVCTYGRLQIGPVTATEGFVTAVDLKTFSSLAGLKVGGFLGNDFLGDRPFTLDWRAGTLTLYDRDKFSPPNGVQRVPLQLRGELPVANARIGPCTGWFMLDTGEMAGLMIDQRAWWASAWKLPIEHWINDTRPLLQGKHQSGFSMSIGPNEILGKTTASLKVRCFELDQERNCYVSGVVGADYLSQARVTFDYARQSAWVQWYTDADRNDWFGKTADANQKDLLGRTPLMEAAREGNGPAVAALIKRGARINDVDVQDMTPLLFAASYGHPIAVRLLLAAHADTGLTSAVGGRTALHLACLAGDLESVNALLDAGAKVDATDLQHWTPLVYAASAGYPRVVERLIRAKANVNVGGGGPLLFATGYGDAESVAALLSAGAEVNPGPGKQPLIWASGMGKQKMVELLLKHGADVNASDDAGQTALMRAARVGNTEIALLLLRSGADPKIKTADGHSAVDLAHDDLREMKLFLRPRHASHIPAVIAGAIQRDQSSAQLRFATLAHASERAAAVEGDQGLGKAAIPRAPHMPRRVWRGYRRGG